MVYCWVKGVPERVPLNLLWPGAKQRHEAGVFVAPGWLCACASNGTHAMACAHILQEVD